jgi:hypothetical protein
MGMLASGAGCQRSSTVGSGSGVLPSSAGAPPADDPAVAPCGREVTRRDVAAIFGVEAADVTIRPSTVTPDACDMLAGPGRIVTIVLRAGPGIEDSWRLAVNLAHGSMLPLENPGGQALRTPNGSEVLVRERALSCQVDLTGADATPAQQPGFGGHPKALAQRLEGLCAKVFAHRNPRGPA